MQNENKEATLRQIYLHILHYFNKDEVNADEEDSIMNKIKDLCYKFSQRWKHCYRKKERFLINNKLWLEGKLEFSELQSIIVTYEEAEPKPSTSRRRGHRKSNFIRSSDKTKKRRIKSLLEANTSDELICATQLSLYKEGHRDAAALLKEITSTSPKRATHVKVAFHSAPSESRRLSKEEALATYLDGKMNKRSYLAVQNRLKSAGCKVFPPYSSIIEAKKECYPDSIQITEISADIDLMDLLTHTINRICQVQKEVLLQTKNFLNDVQCILKWGCDGSSGYSPYKQSFSEGKEELDNAIFVISLVPLQLYNITIANAKQILWQNPTPSSAR